MRAVLIYLGQNLIKDSEGLLQILRGLLLSFPLDHQLHELSEVDRAGPVSIRILEVRVSCGYQCKIELTSIMSSISSGVGLLPSDLSTAPSSLVDTVPSPSCLGNTF